jgi:hypothetical protein
MSITFKLVGINTGYPHILEIRKDMVGSIKLKDIMSLFEILGLSADDFDNEKIRFVANAETIKNPDKEYLIESDTHLNIFVFSSNPEIKVKLSDIFVKHATNLENGPKNEHVSIPVARPLVGTVVDNSAFSVKSEINEKPDEYLQKPIIDNEIDEEPMMTVEIVEKMNKKAVEDFKDKDFRELVRIYYENPDVIKKFISFITNGSIIDFKSSVEERDYTEEMNRLKELGIKTSDEKIREALKSTSGHLNLALRVLLCTEVVEE